MRNRPIIARATLLAYLVLLLQPCAMAMGHEPAGHHDDCHHDTLHLDAETCLSQPVSDCATDGSLVESKDSSSADTGFQPISATVFVVPGFIPTTATESRYFTRAPPPGGPALNIRHCVFLK